MNINKLMKQAQAMQKKMEEMQEKVAQMEETGTAGGGMVSITVNGKGEMKKVTLDPAVVDPEDIETLEDLIIAAFNDAKGKIDATTGEEMAKVTSGMGLPPGMKMPM